MTFLIARDNISNSQKFIDTDSKELFEKNLKIQKADWHYRDCDITYNLNSKGYRCKEFSEYDISKSIIVLGCSNVMGVGVAEKETIAYQLEYLTGIPCINLGAGGSSCSFSYANCLKIAQMEVKPLAVVNFWSCSTRLTLPLKNSKAYVHGGVWNFEKYPIVREYADNKLLQKFYTNMYSENCKLLFKDIKYIEATHFETTAELLNLHQITNEDRARDISETWHPGRATHLKAANYIIKNL